MPVVVGVGPGDDPQADAGRGRLMKFLEEKAERMAKAESMDMGKVLESSAGDDLKRQVRAARAGATAASI